jgi:hypothetical protein
VPFGPGGTDRAAVAKRKKPWVAALCSSPLQSRAESVAQIGRPGQDELIDDGLIRRSLSARTWGGTGCTGCTFVLAAALHVGMSSEEVGTARNERIARVVDLGMGSFKVFSNIYYCGTSKDQGTKGTKDQGTPIATHGQ